MKGKNADTADPEMVTVTLPREVVEEMASPDPVGPNPYYIIAAACAAALDQEETRHEG